MIRVQPTHLLANEELRRNNWMLLIDKIGPSPSDAHHSAHPNVNWMKHMAEYSTVEEEKLYPIVVNVKQVTKDKAGVTGKFAENIICAAGLSINCIKRNRKHEGKSSPMPCALKIRIRFSLP